MSDSETKKPPSLLVAFLIGMGCFAVAWGLYCERLSAKTALTVLFALCGLSVGMLAECWRWIRCCARYLGSVRFGEVDGLRREITALTLEREISLVAASGVDSTEAAQRITELLGLALDIRGAAVLVARRNALLPLFACWGRRRAQLERAVTILPPTLLSAAINAYSRSAQTVVNIARKTAVIIPFGGEDGATGTLIVVVPRKQAETALYICRQVLRPISVALRVPALYERAVFDALTSLFSRRHLEAELPRIFSEAKRTHHPLSIIMLDIDHFKRINDTYGHRTGDEVLAKVAKVLRSCLRSYDTAFRYGGEEFCVALPRTALPAAAKVAERIRKTVQETEFLSADGTKIAVTVSLGVAQLASSDANHTSVIERADAALYEAKQSGRNRVVTATAQLPTQEVHNG